MPSKAEPANTNTKMEIRSGDKRKAIGILGRTNPGQGFLALTWVQIKIYYRYGYERITIKNTS